MRPPKPKRRHSRQQLKVLSKTWGSTFVLNEGQTKAEKRRAQRRIRSDFFDKEEGGRGEKSASEARGQIESERWTRRGG